MDQKIPYLLIKSALGWIEALSNVWLNIYKKSTEFKAYILHPKDINCSPSIASKIWLNKIKDILKRGLERVYTKSTHRKKSNYWINFPTLFEICFKIWKVFFELQEVQLETKADRTKLLCFARRVCVLHLVRLMHNERTLETRQRWGLIIKSLTFDALVTEKDRLNERVGSWVRILPLLLELRITSKWNAQRAKFTNKNFATFQDPISFSTSLNRLYNKWDFQTVDIEMNPATKPDCFHKNMWNFIVHWSLYLA